MSPAATAVVLASNNAHKVREISRIVAPLGLVLKTLADFPALAEPPETSDTFEGNALEKANFVFAHTGLPTLADDSGLEVDALGGGPGVHSKRFTPEATAEANNQKLLAELREVEARDARFVCALALVSARGEACVRGTVEGKIARAPRGDGGFGYDPLFLPKDAPGKSMAELAPQEKDAISHRGRALIGLPGMLDDLVG
jgi:XTP/dITP diphosphohydrolase